MWVLNLRESFIQGEAKSRGSECESESGLHTVCRTTGWTHSCPATNEDKDPGNPTRQEPPQQDSRIDIWIRNLHLLVASHASRQG